MADFVRSLRDAVLKIKDGTGTPLETTVEVAEGDLKITMGKNVLELMDRGALHEIKKGDEVPMEWSFSAKFHGFVKPSSVGVLEALFQKDGASAWVSTRDATSDVYTVDIEFQLKDKDASVDETITLPDCFVLKGDMIEGDPNTVAVSGRSWATYPTIS